MGVSVVPGQIRTAAGKIDEAATGAGAHQPGDDIGAVSGALAGSGSAEAATSLETGWNTRFRIWRTEAEAHAKALRSAADNWSTQDEQAAAAYRRLVHRTGGVL
jgi:hypothetical protein